MIAVTGISLDWFGRPSIAPEKLLRPLFTKNRERLITGDIASECMTAVLNQAPVKPLLSDDHFSVDGTLL